MDADREIEDAFRDAEEFHPLRNAEDDPLSSSSDDAIALRFADRHASDLRFVAKWGQWLRHNGRQWRHDDTLHARDLARDVCRVSAEEFDYKTAVKIQSAKTISAVELLARADRRLAATVDQWDADPWLLNTPDGVVDLKTGILRPHRMICGLRPRGRFRVKGSGFVKDRTGFVKDRKSAKKRGKAGFGPILFRGPAVFVKDEGTSKTAGNLGLPTRGQASFREGPNGVGDTKHAAASSLRPAPSSGHAHARERAVLLPCPQLGPHLAHSEAVASRAAPLLVPRFRLASRAFATPVSRATRR